MRQIMHYDAEFRREEATSAVGSHLLEQLMREIMKYDGEFRWGDAAGAIGSHARH